MNIDVMQIALPSHRDQIQKLYLEELSSSSILILNDTCDMSWGTMSRSSVMNSYSSLSISSGHRYPPIEFITSTLAELGFSVGGVYGLLTETLIRPEVFFDKEGPLQKSWRNMDR